MKPCMKFFFFIFSSALAFSQTPFHTIEQYQDLRISDLPLLLTGLHDSSPVMRERSALALANLQDTSAVPALVDALRDPNSRVRRMVAFALGQIGSSAIPKALLDRFKKEREINVIGSILEALGKTGDSLALVRVVAFTDSVVSVELQREAALALARFAIRGIKNNQGVQTTIALCSHADRDVRGNAAYALMRMSPFNADTSSFERVLMILGDENIFVSMHAATVLGKNKALIAEDALCRTAQYDPDWRVRVNSIRAIAMLPEVKEETINRMSELLRDTNEHVSLTMLDIFPEMILKTTISSKQKLSIHTILKGMIVDTTAATSWRQQGEAAVALAKIFGVEENSLLIGQLSRIPERIPRMLEAISLIPETGNIQIFRYYLSRKDTRIAVAALNGTVTLFSHLGTTGTPVRKGIVEDIQRQLLSEETAIAATAAEVLMDSLFLSFVDPKIIAASVDTYEKRDEPEVITAILHLAGKIDAPETKRLLDRCTRSSNWVAAKTAMKELNVPAGDERWNAITKRSVPKHTDYDWALLDSLQAKPPRVEIVTKRGSFVVELFPFDAPFTSILFTRLVRSEFYKNLTFHRVVPNFVVQGGDPSGTGWGGPGFSIRTEVSPLRFDRGMVGVASAGKDTEGCQFFITHSPQPHLDGRYTIFARVVEGMDIVDQIQIGDEIDEMRIMNW